MGWVTDWDTIIYEFVEGRILEKYVKDICKVNSSRRTEEIAIDLILRILRGYRRTYEKYGCVNGDLSEYDIIVVGDNRGRIKRVVFCDNETTSRITDRGRNAWHRKRIRKEGYISLSRKERLEDRETPDEQLCLPKDDLYALCIAFLNMTKLRNEKRMSPRLKQLRGVLRRYRNLSEEKYDIAGLIREIRKFKRGANTNAPAAKPRISSTASRAAQTSVLRPRAKAEYLRRVAN
jgi:hypothetical protein